MAVNPMTGLLNTPVPEIPKGPDEPLPGSRPPEIGNEELRVEDIMAWLEGMDPLKPVKIVMASRNFSVSSDIQTIIEENGFVNIFPAKMPSDQKDIRTMLSEKTIPPPKTKMETAAEINSDMREESDAILEAIRKRKKGEQTAKNIPGSGAGISDYLDMLEAAKAAEKEHNRVSLAGRQRERLTGAG